MWWTFVRHTKEDNGGRRDEYEWMSFDYADEGSVVGSLVGDCAVGDEVGFSVGELVGLELGE